MPIFTAHKLRIMHIFVTAHKWARHATTPISHSILQVALYFRQRLINTYALFEGVGLTTVIPAPGACGR